MATDADARKCAFSVRIDAALADQAFNAPIFRFRFVDGTKKQTSVVGAAGWTPHPETSGSWRFEVVIPDVVVTETLAAAIDDDPVIAFVLSDQNTPPPAAPAAPATAKAGNTSARPTTAVVAAPSPQDAGSRPTGQSTTSGRGRLVADVLELDASALFAADCLHIEQTWTPLGIRETETLDLDDSIFTRPKKTPSIVSRSLFTTASGIRSITIRVSVDQPLLSPALRLKLNPLVLTLGIARRLPGVGIVTTSRPHDALASRCRPVYAVWRFFPDRRLYPSPSQHPTRSRLAITSGREHSETVDWQHTTTVLCGRCDAMELYDALQTSSLTVEIHDRDAIRTTNAALDKLHTKWESLYTTGIDPTQTSPGDALATPSTARSRNTTPRGGGTIKPLDVFAVDEIMKHDWHTLLSRTGERCAFGGAVFRLHDLLPKAKVLTAIDPTGMRPYMTLKLTSDVLASKRRAQPIGAAALAESESGDPTANATVDTPLDRLVREPGAYVASGTTLSLHVTLQHALAPPPPRPPASTALSFSSSPAPLFSRFVVLFPYSDTSTLTQLMRVLETANRLALPDGISLRSYELTPHETRACDSGELDILTGCMVLDDAFRVVILEGLADGAMQHVHRALPRTQPQSERFRMYANEQLRFTERLYTAFGVDLKRIKLRSALPVLLQMPDMYMRTKVAAPCYNALMRLMELRRVHRLVDVKTLDLFPTAAMLREVESKYGESISLEDIDGRKKMGISTTPAEPESETHSHDNGGDDTVGQEAGDSDRPPHHASSTHTRLKAPTDAMNPEFEAHRRARQPRDYLEDRRKLYDEQQLAYRQKKQAEDDALHSDPRANAPVYLYSGQKLRTQDALQEDLRQRLASDHRATYTYGPDFQSLALSLVNPDELRQTEERDARKKWTTQRGFVYPAPRPTAEFYQHPDAPSAARCEDLRVPFVDNVNHPTPVSRDTNRRHDRRPDFSTLPSKDLVFGGTHSDGSVDLDYFRSVHLCGEQARKEMDEALEHEKTEWERKLVIDRTQIKFLAHGNIYSQPSATALPSTQLDKLRDVLKGPVRSKPLRIVRNATLPSGKRVPLLPPPASILSRQAYAGPVAATFANTLRKAEENVSFLVTDASTGTPKDFHFPSVSHLLTPPVQQHTTHKEIRAIEVYEKHGFLWRNHTQ